MSVEETIVYELVLVPPASRRILAIDSAGERALPRVQIPRWTRPAAELQKAIRATYGLDVIVLDFPAARENGLCRAIAELLAPNNNSELSEVEPEDIPVAMVDNNLESSIASGSTSPMSQLGWIDEAIVWLESVTQLRLLSKSRIEQLNAGGAFSLLCFPMEDGSHYWLKATSEPHAHEYSITCFMSELCGPYLPTLISTRPSWNAWLMSGETARVMQLPTDPATLIQFLEDAVESMAELQIRTVGRHSDLLNAGAFDQRLEVFQRHSEEVFDYLEEAMSLQISTRAARLPKSRLRESRTLFEDVCRRTETLGLPQTVVHGDLNLGNILPGSGRCKFLDWCEAYIGDPLISLEHLLRLNQVDDSALKVQINRRLKRRYRDIWAKAFDPNCFERGFLCMSVLAIFSSLLGRGDWLTSSRRNDPRFQSYSRTLARHLDRAVREPALMEARCD